MSDWDEEYLKERGLAYTIIKEKSFTFSWLFAELFLIARSKNDVELRKDLLNEVKARDKLGDFLESLLILNTKHTKRQVFNESGS